MGYDNWAISGNWHKCPICGSGYSDSDNGCGCTDDKTDEQIKDMNDAKNEAELDRALSRLAMDDVVEI